MYEDLSTMLRGIDSYESILSEMRRFKRGEELRIGLKYILREADLIKTMEDLSNLAGVYLMMAFEVSDAELRGKYGSPKIEDQDGGERDCGFSIIGMGKLGGYELDFGSDLDLIFVYAGDGNTSGIKYEDKDVINSITNNEYFSKLCRMIFNIVGGGTSAGFAYRIDTGLRPDGEKGAVVLPINGFRDYFSKRAETWERQALIKSRPIAGDEELGREFIKIAHLFAYREEFDPSIISEINHMRERMESELVGRGDSQRDIKVGYGGIVDIEFITQLFQLRYGGRDPSLRTTKTLDALAQLNLKGLISDEDFQQLTESYNFLRRIENGLRIRNERSINVLPHSPVGLIRLAKMLGYSSDKNKTEGDKLLYDYRYSIERVRKIYTTIFK
jgi:glutamate-ammonia-ligase adenylyltransferase